MECLIPVSESEGPKPSKPWMLRDRIEEVWREAKRIGKGVEDEGVKEPRVREEEGNDFITP